jgi:flagellar capping protein FliD
MNNIMDDVQVAWQSDYTYKYLDATKEVQGDIKSVSSDIYRLGDTINEISQQLKQTESDLSNRFSKM